MAKKNIITVKDVSIRTMTVNGIDYICITDIARQKNEIEPKDVVKNWMRQKNTLEYLGLWERLHNPNFKGVEFDPLLAEAGSNAFTMSPSRWVELTAAIGIFTKNGAGGGTYAQRDIAFKFANWVSVEFELYLVMEFQRLKAKEQEQIGWTAKRELSKINYRIHTDAIKHHLIPEEELQDHLAESMEIQQIATEYGYDLSLYQPGNEGVVIGDFGEKARLLFEQERISEGHYVELLNLLK